MTLLITTFYLNPKAENLYEKILSFARVSLKKNSRDIRNLVDFNFTDFAIDNFNILIDQDQCKWSKLQTSYSASIIQEF